MIKNMDDKFEERKVKIENTIEYINTFIGRRNPVAVVEELYNEIMRHMCSMFDIFPPFAPRLLTQLPRYTPNSDTHLTIIGSNDKYSLVSSTEGHRIYGACNSFIFNKTYYYNFGNICHCSVNIMGEKMILGDLNRTQYQDLLNVLYELPNVEQLIQNYMGFAAFKKCPSEERKVKLMFDNDVSVDISEIWLATYSPVYNMLYTRGEIKEIWHLPGSPTLHIAELLKKQLLSNNSKIKEILTLDELNFFIEIFQFIGLEYNPTKLID